MASALKYYLGFGKITGAWDEFRNWTNSYTQGNHTEFLFVLLLFLGGAYLKSWKSSIGSISLLILSILIFGNFIIKIFYFPII